jgi:hypothetical protein
LPVETSQADLGAQDFWLHCLPCHGDRGQGLTDEFRLLYPVEEQNCWESGCHGNRPYENGWRLPEFVPAILGDQLLSQFKTAGGLFNFIQSAMPYQNPGSLNDVTYFQLVSFLTRENGLLAPNVTIVSNNASSIFFQGIGQITPAVTAILQLPSGTAVAPTIQEAENARNTEQNNSTLYILFGLLMLTILVLGLRAVLL